MAIIDRFQNAWNAFKGRDPTEVELPKPTIGGGSYRQPSRFTPRATGEQSIKNTLITRISMDVAAVPLYHILTDEDGNYTSTIKDDLNDRLTFRANKDQTAREFMQDVCSTMLEYGAAAIVPIDTSSNPHRNTTYKIYSWRVGRIMEWYPDHIKVLIYDDRTGIKKQIYVEKRNAAIIQNPFYAVMNEPNVALQKLTRKMSMDDELDRKNGSNKLDMIIQFPYSTSSEKRTQMAKERKQEIETQLAQSQYGIAYIDVNERIIQLNRSIENQLQGQIEYYEKRFFTMTGMTAGIIDGTANETEMNNYYNRCIEPILSAIADNIKMAFLTKTAITGGHTIMFFKDPFKLMAISQVADLGDRLTRNEIMSPNEFRAKLGLKPSGDPNSDELRNRNIAQPPMGEEGMPMEEDIPYEEGEMPPDGYDDQQPPMDEGYEEEPME